MYRFIVVFFLLASFCVNASEPDASAKGIHFKGVIVDKASGEALAGVKVTITGTNLAVYTNFDGEFEFDGLVPGTYNINCEMITYNSIISAKINLNAESDLKPVLLKITPAQSPEINSNENNINLG